MKNRHIVAVALIGLVLLWAPAAWSASTLTRLGNHPFYKPPLTSVDDLKYMVKRNMVDLMEGFEEAGLPGFFDDFDQQFPTAEIDLIQVRKGETLRWMFYKRLGKGKVRVARQVTWGAEEPFEAFRFHIDHAGRRHEIVVPLICGNVALRDVGPIPKPAPEPEPEPVPNLVPTCASAVTPLSAEIGRAHV